MYLIFRVFCEIMFLGEFDLMYYWTDKTFIFLCIFMTVSSRTSCGCGVSLRLKVSNKSNVCGKTALQIHTLISRSLI